MTLHFPGLSLLDTSLKSTQVNDEIDLLTLLIEKWDEDNNMFSELAPIQLML